MFKSSAKVFGPPLRVGGPSKSGIKDFDYTFNHISEIMEHFLEQLGIGKFVMYVFDYGVWGENDPSFIPAGAKAFKRDLPNAEIYL